MGRRRRRKEDSTGQLFVLLAFGITGYVFMNSSWQDISENTNGVLYAGTLFFILLFGFTGIEILIKRSIRHRRFEQKAFQFDSQANIPTPSEFEHEVAWIIQRITGHRTKVIGGSGDRGIDIEIYDQNRLVGIVQCKRFASHVPVGPNYVRELHSCKERLGVTAYLVTTSFFTEASKREAKQLGIKLFDGDDLVRLRMSARKQVAVKARA